MNKATSDSKSRVVVLLMTSFVYLVQYKKEHCDYVNMSLGGRRDTLVMTGESSTKAINKL